MDSKPQFDLDLMKKLYQTLIVEEKPPMAVDETQLAGVDKKFSLKDRTPQIMKEYEDIGLQKIAGGEVAALIMSGGQGTRLGFDKAKGMFNAELQSQKTIFHISCEKVIRLNAYAREKFPELAKNKPQDLVKLYIMTSDTNDVSIKSYFKENKNFGLGDNSVLFLKQDSLPAIWTKGQAKAGEVIYNTPTEVFNAPNGNGGLYKALKDSGSLANMKKEGVKYIQILGIDNILNKIADPVLVGYTVKQNLEVVSKYATKANWKESVGMHVIHKGSPWVIEYSDMNDKNKQREEKDGSLTFGQGFLATFVGTMDFFERVQNLDAYHVAKKAVPYWDESEKKLITPADKNGVKFELFIFDAFPMIKSGGFGLMEVSRDEEFAPIKNKNAEGAVDTPDTARDLISKLHQKQLIAAGFDFGGKSADGSKQGLCEIDSNISYFGEGLEKLKPSGKVDLPYYLKK